MIDTEYDIMAHNADPEVIEQEQENSSDRWKPCLGNDTDD